MLLHRSQDLLGSTATRSRRGLPAVKDAGMVEAVGVSVYAPEELEALELAHAVGTGPGCLSISWTADSSASAG